MPVSFKARADIMVKGYREENYFPLKLAASFVKNIFDVHVDETELLDTFMSYVPDSEADNPKTCV